MNVVIQILLYNESFATIDRLFSSLELVQYPRESWAIVVVNNRCDGADIAEYFERRWRKQVGVTLPETVFYAQENTGFAGGHNDAYAHAKKWSPEFVYLLNGDAHVAPDVLSTIMRYAASRPGVAIVQSRIMSAQSPDRYNSAGNAMHFLGFGFSLANGSIRDANRPIEIERGGLPMFYASGAGMLIRVSVLDDIGDMFPGLYFMYHEDLDICWRARLAGFEIGYADDSVVYHHYEFSRSMRKFYWMERNRHLTNLCNYRIGTLLLIAPPMLIMELGTLLFAFRSGWWKEKLRSWEYFLHISTWRYVRERRAFIRTLRRRSDKEIFGSVVGVVVSQEVESVLMTRVVNPVMTVYLSILKRILWW